MISTAVSGKITQFYSTEWRILDTFSEAANASQIKLLRKYLFDQKEICVYVEDKSNGNLH